MNHKQYIFLITIKIYLINIKNNSEKNIKIIYKK